MNKYEANRRRKYALLLRLDEEEHMKLKEWSAASKRSMSDYLRDLIDHCQPIAFPPAEYEAILYELRKIGINMNQLAGKANAYGFSDEREYRAESERLWRVVAELSRQMVKGGAKFGSNKDMGC